MLSFSTGAELLKAAKLDELAYVSASDDVSRHYRSSTEELQAAAKRFTKTGTSLTPTDAA